MSENAAILLGALYEAYLKGRNLDGVKATEIGLSKKAIVEAGNELKADGYLVLCQDLVQVKMRFSSS